MACRDLLLRLERKELISLPPRKCNNVNRKRIAPVLALFNQASSNLLSGRIDEYRQIAACFGWGSAAWKVDCRDRFIDWDDEQRRSRLHCIANNVRFLILPWVQVKHFASKSLALSTRVLQADWQQAFSDELLLVETFVDCSRFRGTCYRAANWLYLGQTKGSAKRGASYRHHGLRKSVFVYPLTPIFRERLCR